MYLLESVVETAKDKNTAASCLHDIHYVIWIKVVTPQFSSITTVLIAVVEFVEKTRSVSNLPFIFEKMGNEYKTGTSKVGAIPTE